MGNDHDAEAASTQLLEEQMTEVRPVFGTSDLWPLLSQLPEVHTNSCDNISQFSVDSITSQESKEPVFIAAGDIRYGQTTLP